MTGRKSAVSPAKTLQKPKGIQLVEARETDGKKLADLRVTAMRPSLEAVGRFDPDRARQRFLSGFAPRETWKLMIEGRTAGFLVLRQRDDHLYLDHLYVEPSFQGSGIGQFALDHAKGRARSEKLPIRLMALKGSPANAFYLTHGFVSVGGDDIDTLYEWKDT